MGGKLHGAPTKGKLKGSHNGRSSSTQFSLPGSISIVQHRRVSMEIRSLRSAVPFITKDGSEIRELLAYRNSFIRNQSLAEARLPAGSATQEHYHARTEEIYFITSGRGHMRIENEEADVGAGDAIAIPPGKRHKLWNTGDGPLTLLCCCAPCYEHSDTFVTET
jgi:mannose-6-phosphate isomerase-like protein (cupin superfamily)